jgi:alpha-aminoadipate carrier protein LysW
MILLLTVQWHSKQRRHGRELTSYAAVYNTLHSGGRGLRTPTFENNRSEGGAVIRCPECSAEIDVDEDEVEEGEILSCPECESELEVSQTHPVHLNLIADDADEEDDEEEEEKTGENGDLIDEEDDEEDEEDDEE